MGNSIKYPYPAMDGFHILTLFPLTFGNSKTPYPPFLLNFNHKKISSAKNLTPLLPLVLKISKQLSMV